jgi:hypothetical protein
LPDRKDAVPQENYGLATELQFSNGDERNVQRSSCKKGFHPGKQGGEQNIERKAKRYWLIGIGSIA